MRRALSVVVTLAWGLWFGGIILIFIAVTSLFDTFERKTAGMAASGIFRRFEVYQLALGATALLATLGWRMLAARSRLKTALLVCFALATLMAIASATVVTPMIEGMRVRGEAGTPRFGMMHGISSSVYLAEAVILLGIGLLLPSAVAADRRTERAAAETEADRATSKEQVRPDGPQAEVTAQ